MPPRYRRRHSDAQIPRAAPRAPGIPIRSGSFVTCCRAFNTGMATEAISVEVPTAIVYRYLFPINHCLLLYEASISRPIFVPKSEQTAFFLVHCLTCVYVLPPLTGRV